MLSTTDIFNSHYIIEVFCRSQNIYNQHEGLTGIELRTYLKLFIARSYKHARKYELNAGQSTAIPDRCQPYDLDCLSKSVILHDMAPDDSKYQDADDAQERGAAECNAPPRHGESEYGRLEDALLA